MASVNAEFDIFAPITVQVGVQEIVEVTYKPIATIDQSYLEFSIPADSDIFIDPDIHIFVCGHLVSPGGKALASTDHMSVSIFCIRSLVNAA
jgi:hypothetical protein